MRLLDSLLLLVVLYSFEHAGGQSGCFVPSTDPLNDISLQPSPLDTVFLYPNVANCNGLLNAYEFCYLFNRNTGRRAIVFTALILRDNGDSYTVVASFDEREDRSCDVDANDRCCKTIQDGSGLTIDSGSALAFIIPSDTGGNQLLLASTSSPGYQIQPRVALPSTGGTVSKSNLQSAIQVIPDLSFRLVLRTLTTSGPSLSTPLMMMQNDSAPAADGGSNSGAIAAGVLVPLLVLAGVGVTVVIIVVLVKKSSGDSYDFGSSSKRQEWNNNSRNYQNSIYGGNRNGTDVNGFTMGNPLTQSRPGSTDLIDSMEPYENMQSGVIHEYAIVEEGGRSSYYIPCQSASSVISDISSRSKAKNLPSRAQNGIGPYAGMEVETTRSMHSISISLVSSRRGSRDDLVDDDGVYQNPACNEDSLYDQYKRINIRHIARSELEFQDYLGSGQFGTVYKGVWNTTDEHKIDVALKTLNEEFGEEEKVKFLQEAAIMGQFSHPNVVHLHGVLIFEQPKMLILELLSNGDLRNHLLSLKSKSIQGLEDDLPHTLLSFCRQIASGMSYLAHKSFIHRDLAARNILVSEDEVCKIADFGMSRDLDDMDYYVAGGGKVPVRWTAPEAIHLKKYSTASDVWSYGCVMYEIWSLGHKPFDSYTNAEVVNLIDTGIRLPPPPGCPKTVYTLMVECWHPTPFHRPSFPSIVQKLSMPDTKILKWSDEDKAVHPEASTLGAGLDTSVDMYKNIQEIYLLPEIAF